MSATLKLSTFNSRVSRRSSDKVSERGWEWQLGAGRPRCCNGGGPRSRAGVGGKSSIAPDTRPATRMKGWKIMSEPTLTDAVIQAVTFADTLIRHPDWYSQGLESLVRTEVEALDPASGPATPWWNGPRSFGTSTGGFRDVSAANRPHRFTNWAESWP